jgi:hypothetical protein
MSAVEYNFGRRLIEPPAQRLHMMTIPRHIQRKQYKQPTHLMCPYTNAKEYRIGLKLPARHPLHPKADLQLFDPILAALPTLVNQCLILLLQAKCHILYRLSDLQSNTAEGLGVLFPVLVTSSSRIP